ncbi:hypothetical protein BSKO_03444 [Bryopsis sp. KO-2023]|nr:hypothetical protein BSKO_03444 [Bryopsis sp. KO-2023]
MPGETVVGPSGVNRLAKHHGSRRLVRRQPKQIFAADRSYGAGGRDLNGNSHRSGVGREIATKAVSFSGDGDIDLGPYKYDSRELKELADMMPDRLDATLKPRSKLLMKQLLDKYDLDTSTLFEDEEEIDLSEAPKWLDSKKEPSMSGFKEPLPEQMGFPLPQEGDLAGWDFFITNVEMGYEAKKELQLQRVFDQALKLHHSQNFRAKNIYAVSMWYAKVLEQVELWDNYEGGDPSPIPSFVRALYILEESFDDLNEKQIEVDRKIAERSDKLQEAMFYNWVEENLDVTIDFASPIVKDGSIAKSDVVEEEEEESTTLEIDDLLHGLIPNAEPEGRAEDDYDDFTKDLLEGGSGDLEFRETSADLTFQLPDMKDPEESPT